MNYLGKDDVVTFSINGKIYHVNGTNVTSDMSLNTFIRTQAQLPGTKYMCREGGCGACIVTVEATHPVTKKDRFYAVNSCLVPILSCHGISITTVEGIGNRVKGYHPIQRNLAKFNGTQCGYCSPGMVMNMYSLLKGNPNITMKEVENSFGGNICRCTGYRPILDAFKSMAKDASEDLKQKSVDIEDLMKKKCSLKEGKCDKSCSGCNTKVCQDEETDFVDFLETALAPKSLKIELNQNKLWYKVGTVFEIMQVFDLIGDNSYMLVAGNTAQGVFPVTSENQPNVYIDISSVAELKDYTVYNDHIEIGANMGLTEFMNLLSAISKENPLFFEYLQVLADHIDLVANVPVRNIGTIAGNLMIKHEHNEFQSDIFLILELAGATIITHELSGVTNSLSLLEFLNTPMDKTVITSIILPPLSSNHYRMRSFKIMPRKQNVHAMVNAGFLFRINKKSYVIEETPKIIFGAINPQFVHACKTESFLTGKQIFNPHVLHYALKLLNQELTPNFDPPEASPLYRRNLALSLFYKFVLSINPNIVNKFVRSGAENLERPLSSGKQDFATDKTNWPVNQPVQKLEANVQSSGEAEYVDDIPKSIGELFGTLVITDVACTTITSIDPSKALAIPGVVAFYSAKDIPGKNSFISQTLLTPEDEEIFCSGKVTYAGQPVGVIIAESQELANEARQYVKITYGKKTKPLLTIKEVLQSGDATRKILQMAIKPTATRENIVYKINGELELEGQYHYTMELHSCICIPKEDGLKVYSATQWMYNVQSSIAKALDIPENTIDVEVKRLGGAYGCKIARSSLIANACAIAAHHLHQPVRVVLDLQTTMKSIGKRYPLYAKYETAVDAKGVIQYLNLDIYNDYGISLNEAITPFVNDGLESMYDMSIWKANIYAIKTDHHSSVWTRSPGTLEGITLIDNIMEHISYVTKQDSISVKLANSLDLHKPAMEEMIKTIKSSSNFTERLEIVKQINSNNRWRKRGISLMPMKFEILFFPGYYSLVSIYSNDGTVAITHGGIEIGQGINTKVAQVCAYALGIDLDMVKIKPAMSITSPNNFTTGGSLTSDVVCSATLKCCEILNERLKPIRDKMDKPKWKDVVLQAAQQGIDLCANHMYTLTDALPQNYPVYGVTVLEAELDVLTGQYQILRADILEDAGESISPYVDIGQVEGAFVMGLGYFHSEQIVYDPKNGETLTNRTWTYWPPGVKDIPIDFRVTLRKNSKNPLGVLRSKATGEPPLVMSGSLRNALRQAVASARKDAGLKDEWFQFDQPCTFEKTFLATGTDYDKFFL